MLDEIGKRHNTDKSSSYRSAEGVESPGHDLLRHYESAIGPSAETFTSVLDIGAGFAPNHFASARAWAEYLPNAGVAVVDCEDLDPPLDERISFHRLDIGDIRALTALASTLTPQLVVEDASHLWTHQMHCLMYILPRVAPGGLYIVEDVHTSSPCYEDHFSDGMPVSTLDSLSILAQMVALKHAPDGVIGGSVYRGNRTHLFQTHLEQFHGPSLSLLEALAANIDSLTFVKHAVLIRVAG